MEEPWAGICTSSGFHDEQLTPEMFYALRHVEVAARLEYMAEARGRPCPGHAHPDAEVEDPDCAPRGERQESDPEFEDDAALPGGDDQAADGEPDHALDLQWDYRPQHRIVDEVVFGFDTPGGGVVVVLVCHGGLEHGAIVVLSLLSLD